MTFVAWVRDWTIISVAPWFAIYLLWHGPILGGLLLCALTVGACMGRHSA